MGQELITYLVKCPVIITKKRAATAMRRAIARRAKLFKDYRDGAAFADDFKNAARAYPWVENLVDALGNDAEDGYLWLENANIKTIIANFEKLVREGARDASSRLDPDTPKQLLLCAGDASWGDEPEGFGYQTIKNIYSIGADEDLGVR